MKRWLATFLAVFLAVSTVGQASLAAAMPCGHGPLSMASTGDAGVVADQDGHRHCHKSTAAKDCSDVCKRLCGNTAFAALPASELAVARSPLRLRPSMAAPLLSRATPPDTPPPIA